MRAQKKIGQPLLLSTLRQLPLVAALAWLATPVFAQETPHLTLKDVAQLAVLNSPEVRARWHAFREATEEIDVARGGFLPKLDFSAGAAREMLKQPTAGLDENFYRRTRTLSLNQMLFDGFATTSEVKRLGKTKLVRYFELLDVSENVALEAGRAYLDVLRSRYLVFLAEENYIQHQVALEQLKQRSQSGVGKRVDVEQAASRLALADVNVTTAYANLHDVTARYVRFVGEQPPKVMFAPAQSSKLLPDSAEAALQVALKGSPALRATIENIEASQHDLEARRAGFMPRLDLRARNESINNNLNTPGYRDDSVLEMVMSYNLFNGGADSARSRQYRERKNTALEQREKACRDMRQTLSIAYNETLRLSDQLAFISLQVNLVEKTRAAYRDQFNIGQRTLLDLLNTQNEFFDARRAQVNANTDLAIAYLRTYAGMGRLLEHLGLKRLDEKNSPDDQDLTSIDPAQLCPPTKPADVYLDREALGRKVKEFMENPANNFVAGRTPLTSAPTNLTPPITDASTPEISTQANDTKRQAIDTPPAKQAAISPSETAVLIDEPAARSATAPPSAAQAVEEIPTSPASEEASTERSAQGVGLGNIPLVEPVESPPKPVPTNAAALPSDLPTDTATVSASLPIPLAQTEASMGRSAQVASPPLSAEPIEPSIQAMPANAAALANEQAARSPLPEETSVENSVPAVSVDNASLVEPVALLSNTTPENAATVIQTAEEAPNSLATEKNQAVLNAQSARSEASPAPVVQTVEDHSESVISMDASALTNAQAVAPEAEITKRITDWGAAWVARDTRQYLAFYASDFQTKDGLNREVWARKHEERFVHSKDLHVDLQNLAVRIRSANFAVNEFHQIYVADMSPYAAFKTMEWRKENGQWKIVRETTRTIGKK